MHYVEELAIEVPVANRGTDLDAVTVL